MRVGNRAVASGHSGESPTFVGPCVSRAPAYHWQTGVGLSLFRGRDVDKALALCDLIAARIEVIAALVRLYRLRGRE